MENSNNKKVNQEKYGGKSLPCIGSIAVTSVLLNKIITVSSVIFYSFHTHRFVSYIQRNNCTIVILYR